MLRRPASICLSGPSEVFVPGLIAGSVWRACALAVATMPSLAAAMASAAAPTKRRRLMSSPIVIVSTGQPLHDGSLRGGSAERENENLHTRTEKLDLELAIGYRLRLSDQLVQPLLRHRAVALLVDVKPARVARRLSVDQHAKLHGRSWRGRAHDEIQIAGMKAIRDAAIGRVQHRGFLLHRPVARQRPFIQAQRRGQLIRTRLVRGRPARRRKFLGALVPDIVFRRHQAGPIRGRFEALAIDRNRLMTDAFGAGLAQQRLNDHFRLLVRTLAEMLISNTSLRIDEIKRRPVLVVERTPYDMLTVDRDRVIDPQVFHGPANVVDVFFK